MRQRRLIVASLCVAAAGALSASVAVAAKPVERLTAFAVDMSNLSGRARAGTVDISIDRWSTTQERDQLLAALREGGSDSLLRALQGVKEVGYVRGGSSLGYPLRFARSIDLPGGGRRVIIATDRPISFLEAVNQPRSTDYPFMILDIRLDASGKGEGKLLPLAKISINDDHVVEIENYANEPVRLSSVRKVT